MRSRVSVAGLAAALAGCGGGEALPPPATPAQTALPALPAPAAVGYDAVGYASWYGAEVGGAATASGEPFDPAAMTAAHRTLPLGTVVEVTALDSGRTILARVNDRRPSDPGRLIDLSRAAAQALVIDRHPLAGVRVRTVVAAPGDLVALRSGRAASPRLDAPPALLAALRRQLGTPPGRATAPIVATVRAPRPLRAAPLELPPPPAAPLTGGRYVQVAAFSSQARARGVADRMNGSVLPPIAGGLFRVRLGPFASPVAAQRARDAAVAQGYGDATIVQP